MTRRWEDEEQLIAEGDARLTVREALRHFGSDGAAHHAPHGTEPASHAQQVATDSFEMEAAEAAERWREHYRLFAREVRNGEQARDWLLSTRAVWHEGA
jgi:hypothetical protein